VVYRFAFVVGERVQVFFRRGGEIGGVGFDEETVGGEGAEDFALGGFSVVEKGGGEGEVGAARNEALDHFGGAAVGVEEEAAFGQGVLAEDFPESAPGAEAMDGGGEIALGGDGELPGEAGDLVGEIVAFDPAVEADFADAAAGVGVELGEEVFLPIG
jgi:hypothetical protein